MRSWPVDRPIAGEFVAPLELNAELAELSASAHDIDYDNIGGAAIITGDKVADGTWGKVWTNPITSDGSLRTHTAGDNQVQVFELPNDGDTAPMRMVVDTGDCELALSLGACWSATQGATAVPIKLWLGIRLDGVVVAQSPIGSPIATRCHQLIRQSVPVPAGRHVIDAVYGIHDSGLASTTVVQWRDRRLTAREVAR